MPNDSSGRRPPGSRVSHVRPANGSGDGPSRHVTPLRIGGATLAVVVTLVVAWSLVGGSGRQPGGVAAADSPGPVAAVVSASPSAAGTEPSSAPPSPSEVRETPRPTATPTATPTLAPTPAPTPTASTAPAVGPTAAIPAHALKRKLDAVRTRLAIPGVSVAILWNDGRTWLGASGRADAAGKVPMTTDTAFALASISKTFTAAVVLQLVEEGKIGLDDRVAPLLPAYRLDRRITVRMLLDHTSGLPDFFFGSGIDAALQRATDAAWTPARAWRYVRKHRPVPGKVWAYSNTNYMLLGELVKAVTGRSIAKEVRNRLLDPLDLKAAWYQAVEKPRAPETSGFRLYTTASGVRAAPVARPSEVMPFRSVVTAAGGAGSIAATAEDTARWMQAFAGGKVLSPAVQREMIADMARTRVLKSRIPYGLGIQGVPVLGRAALGHSGRYVGFRNVVRYLPAEGITIAVLTNQGGYDPTRIVNALLKQVLPAR